MSAAAVHRLIFWQNMASPHQSAYLRALAEIPEIGAVHVVFLNPLVEVRRAMGWREPDYGRACVHMNPGAGGIADLLRSEDRCTHIFSDFIADSRLRKILGRAGAAGARIGVLSEGRDWRGFKGLLRKLHACTCERRLSGKTDFVLAIGHLASEWYARCGFDPGRIFEFCYVVERPGEAPEPPDRSEPFQLLFIGQIIRRKRLDLLLHALSLIPGAQWTLRVIGEGPQRMDCEDLSRKCGFESRVQFLGVRENREVRRELAQADALILPSRWDGWGAVVNEALMSGVRVLCSDFCGAGDLVKGTPYGALFQSCSAAALAAALKEQFARGPVSGAERREIIRYGETLSGPSVARYLADIFAFVAGTEKRLPEAPWKSYLRRRTG